MIVEINGDLSDLSAIMVCAERYAMGRRTYMPKLVCEFIINNLHLLMGNDRGAIIWDIEHAYDYGDACDKEAWMKLLKKLKEIDNVNRIF